MMGLRSCLPVAILLCSLLSVPWVPTASAAGNQSPSFTSTPPLNATVGVLYYYDANATDPDGDSLTYFLQRKIDDMALNPSTGVLTWTPSKAGNQSVIIYASDGVTPSTAQTFTINVAPSPNVAPNFTSTPVKVAFVGQLYVYDVNATDPDGEKITFSLIEGPKGMTIDPGSGLISWLPTEDFANTGPVVSVMVKDASFLSNTQAYVLEVKKLNVTLNHPPFFRGTPVTNATAGEPYSYKVDASDPDNDNITYRLTLFPVFMGINNTTGLIQWTPPRSLIGESVPVQVIAFDGKDNTSLNFSIVVRDKAKPPTPVDSGPVTREPEMMCLFPLVFAALCYIGAWAVGYLKRETPARPPAAPRQLSIPPPASGPRRPDGARQPSQPPVRRY